MPRAADHRQRKKAWGSGWPPAPLKAAGYAAGSCPYHSGNSHRLSPRPAMSRRIRHPESARQKVGDKPLNVQGEQKALQGMGCRSGFSTWRIWREKGSKEFSQLCRKKQERRVTAKSDLGQLALPDHGAPHHGLQETRYSQIRNIPDGTLRSAEEWFNWTIKT